MHALNFMAAPFCVLLICCALLTVTSIGTESRHLDEIRPLSSRPAPPARDRCLMGDESETDVDTGLLAVGSRAPCRRPEYRSSGPWGEDARLVVLAASSIARQHRARCTRARRERSRASLQVNAGVT
jgi:hypothetical protein